MLIHLRLDISDSGKFFSAYVPVRAIDDPCLKYAIAALAAKHLGRVKGVISPAGGGLFTSPPTMEVYPNSAQVDWFLKAANYYYLAISHINASVSMPIQLSPAQQCWSRQWRLSVDG